MQDKQAKSLTRAPIVRAMMAEDWQAAAAIVVAETFSAAAAMMGAPANNVSVDFAASLPDWPSRRDACARMGLTCAEAGKPELACAWALLALNPAWKDAANTEMERAFLPALFALADAVADEPALLDDPEFAGRLLGLRYLSMFGIRGGEDPILAAHALGTEIDVDRDEMLLWARRLSSRQED